jgi:hypothetical protein
LARIASFDKKPENNGKPANEAANITNVINVTGSFFSILPSIAYPEHQNHDDAKHDEEHELPTQQLRTNLL